MIRAATLLALAALPTRAAGMMRPFNVGAVVVRSCRLRTDADPLRFSCSRSSPAPQVAKTSMDTGTASNQHNYQVVEVNF